MKVITIATQKGGAGKTTLATNLSVASALSNKTTLLIDADFRQKTALEWFEKRDNKENPLVIEVNDKSSLCKVLDLAQSRNIDRVFIDTQGADAPLVNDAISISDYCLVPCGSGGFDIQAQRITAEVIRRFQKEASFIITKAPPRGKEVEEARVILSGLGINCANHKTSNLKAYKDSAICSLSVMEYEPNGKASQEIKNLFSWLEKKIKKNPVLEEFKKRVKESD